MDYCNQYQYSFAKEEVEQNAADAGLGNENED